jgi:hypothetical protein
MLESHDETVLSLAVDKGIRPTITRLTDEIKRLRTDLAEAEARGRRQGLEEAAKNDHSKDFQLLIVRIIQRHRNGRDLTETLEGAADLLRRKGSLSPFRATAPAETQKPETGESA